MVTSESPLEGEFEVAATEVVSAGIKDGCCLTGKAPELASIHAVVVSQAALAGSVLGLGTSDQRSYCGLAEFSGQTDVCQSITDAEIHMEWERHDVPRVDA